MTNLKEIWLKLGLLHALCVNEIYFSTTSGPALTHARAFPVSIPYIRDGMAGYKEVHQALTEREKDKKNNVYVRNKICCAHMCFVKKIGRALHKILKSICS